MRDEYAIVLDFMPNGYAGSFRKEPTVQAIGEQYLSLLELIARPDAKMQLGDKVYIGQDKREQIQFIKGRLEYSNMTATARSELKTFIEKLVKEKEADFVNFFNKSGAITLRQHSLELLPNIGKKHMLAIIDERDKKSFTSFADISERIKLMPDPKRVVIERIMLELEGNEKYYLFVKSAPHKGGRDRF